MALLQELVPLAVPHAQLSWSSGSCQTGSRGRSCTSTGDCSFSPSVSCTSAGDSRRPIVPAGPSLSLRKLNTEKAWRQFFSDPSQWWDHRPGKTDRRYPDFKHKKTRQSLWLDDKLTPPWVEVELAAVTPGTLQSHSFSWNVRLRQFVKAGDYSHTIELFHQMQGGAVTPDKFTYVAVLNACSGLRSLEKGRRVHEQIVERGCEGDVFVANSLVDMYTKCGSIDDARRVFHKMPSRTVVSWTAMILGYVKQGEGHEALELYHQMQSEGVDPNHRTFVAVLNACASVAALAEGRDVHQQIIERGYECDVFVENSLVDMYAKCGRLEDAKRVFDNMSSRTVVSWNAMVAGFVKCGQGQKALDLYQQMQQERVDPNAVTFVGVLNACASVAAREKGRHVHEQIIERGYDSDLFVGNSLVDMYVKCESIEDAQRVFYKMPSRDLVSFHAMIVGFAKCGEQQKVLELYQQMQQERVYADSITFVAVLNACASVAALDKGRRVHKDIIENHYDSDKFVGNSLIDMYAKCGSIEDAQRVFDEMPSRDVVSWNAMLAGYAMHGQADEAFQHFEHMSQEDVGVNGVTFLCLLSACRHAGLADKGLYYFKSMSEIYNISPAKEHYATVIDLFGRAGHLHEAEDLIRSMPCEADVAVWMSLLGACRTQGNVEMAERIAKRVLELEPENASGYVMLSNIYSAAGRRDNAAILQDQRLGRGVDKQPGCNLMWCPGAP